MCKIFGKIDDKLEVQFRQLALSKFGTERGHISKALEDALTIWIEANKGEYAPKFS